MEQGKEKQAHDVWGILAERKVKMKGISVRIASEELDVSERTIFRMIEDGRLQASKLYLPDGKYIWDINPVSVARLQLQKEEKKGGKDD
jgi:predicted DNA-binding transcriptional regulator YafY